MGHRPWHGRSTGGRTYFARRLRPPRAARCEPWSRRRARPRRRPCPRTGCRRPPAAPPPRRGGCRRWGSTPGRSTVTRRRRIARRWPKTYISGTVGRKSVGQSTHIHAMQRRSVGSRAPKKSARARRCRWYIARKHYSPRCGTGGERRRAPHYIRCSSVTSLPSPRMWRSWAFGRTGWSPPATGIHSEIDLLPAIRSRNQIRMTSKMITTLASAKMVGSREVLLRENSQMGKGWTSTV